MTTPRVTEVTPDVRAVLDAVRETGRTAAPLAGNVLSPLVFAVAVNRGLNPAALQRDLNAYAARTRGSAS